MQIASSNSEETEIIKEIVIIKSEEEVTGEVAANKL